MDRGYAMMLGMSLAYVASLLGMAVAWWSWRKRHGNNDEKGSR